MNKMFVVLIEKILRFTGYIQSWLHRPNTLGKCKQIIIAARKTGKRAEGVCKFGGKRQLFLLLPVCRGYKVKRSTHTGDCIGLVRTAFNTPYPPIERPAIALLPLGADGTSMADRRGSSSAKAEHLVGRQSYVGTSFTLLRYNNLPNSIDFQIHQNRLSATAPPHRAYRSVFCIWGHTISVCNLFNVRLF